MTAKAIETISQEMRREILRLAYNAGKKGAHIAPSLSMVEIMSTLFLGVFRQNKDDFILSKGHGGLCYYVAMYKAGMITIEQLDTFEVNGGLFPGQPSRHKENKVIYSSGSLGMGLSYGAGLAVSSKYDGIDKNIYVLLGDGELNEGSNWEAVMFAKQKRLNNLIAIVDNNEMQSDGFTKDIINMDLQKIWEAFGWNTVLCDGHNVNGLLKAYKNISLDSPTVILAKTVKGKGVSFMENNREWHHNHLNEELYNKALIELESN